MSVCNSYPHRYLEISLHANVFLHVFACLVGLGDEDRHGDVESCDRLEEDGDVDDRERRESSSDDIFSSFSLTSSRLFSVFGGCSFGDLLTSKLLKQTGLLLNKYRDTYFILAGFYKLEEATAEMNISVSIKQPISWFMFIHPYC